MIKFLDLLLTFSDWQVIIITMKNQKRNQNGLAERGRTMKPANDIKIDRIRLGYTQAYMAKALGIPQSTYSNKENDIAKFNDREKVQVASMLGWSPERMNEIFYGGALPIGNERRRYIKRSRSFLSATSSASKESVSQSGDDKNGS